MIAVFDSTLASVALHAIARVMVDACYRAADLLQGRVSERLSEAKRVTGQKRRLTQLLNLQQGSSSPSSIHQHDGLTLVI